MGRKIIKRGPGKHHIDGKDFHLAEEIRYIQRHAAQHDGRFVTIGSLALFSTETGDAWLLDWHETAIQRRSILRKPTPASPSDGRGITELMATHSSTSTRTPVESSPSLAIQPAASRNWVDQEISNMFG